MPTRTGTKPNRYVPHQGRQEVARRLRQAQAIAAKREARAARVLRFLETVVRYERGVLGRVA